MLMSVVLAAIIATSLLPAALDSPGTTILGVEFPRQVPYDRLAVVDVFLRHESVIPSVAAYYSFNTTTTSWRVSVGSVKQITITGKSQLSVYSIKIPDPAYGEVVPAGSRVVFYLEVTDVHGNIVLTASERERWNTKSTDDKFVFTVVDPHPPRIEVGPLDRSPINPTDLDLVVVGARISDDKEKGGSGLREALLRYSLDAGRNWEEVSMQNTGSNFFEGTIPRQPGGAVVHVTVKAMDNVGNTSESTPFFYKVTPAASDSTWYRLAFVASVALAVLLFLAHQRRKRRQQPVGFTKLFYVVAVAMSLVFSYDIISSFRPTSLALLLSLGTVVSILLLDPDLRAAIIVSYVSRIRQQLADPIRRNPARIFLLSTYIILSVSLIVFAMASLSKVLTLDAIVAELNVISSYLILFLTVGVVTQILLLLRKPKRQQ